MKKLLWVLGLLLAFGLGLMIYFYFADPIDRVTSQPLPSAPTMSAKQAILVDGKTGEVLFEKDSRVRAYPASTTKIMTALVVLDLCRQYDIGLNTQVTVPKEATGIEGSSLYLKAGDMTTIENLLYGTMLRSGNDGATALAITLGGNEKHFVRLMNEKAKALGCRNTAFVNPTGLYDENHYTTAEDLAMMARHAMKQKSFRKIVGTKSWESYHNKNKTLFQYNGGTGIKIGFTEKSGRTLVASASREGVSLIAVVLNDGNWFDDAYKLLDYGFMIKGVAKDE